MNDSPWPKALRMRGTGFVRLAVPWLLAISAGLAWGQETVDDPVFGPWYGMAYLPGNEERPNVLPAEAGGDGVQQWASVGEWQVLGPFASSEWTAAVPPLPDSHMKPLVIEAPKVDPIKKVPGKKDPVPVRPPKLPPPSLEPIEGPEKDAPAKRPEKTYQTDNGFQWPPPWGFKPKKYQA